jgi:hypothetical protein
MSEYIVTIVPVIDDEFAGPATQTIVRIDTQAGRPAVKEFTVRAPEGSGLVTSELSYLDIESLLRAFEPCAAADAAPRVDTAAEPEPEPEAGSAGSRRSVQPKGAAPTSARRAAAAGRAASDGGVPPSRAYRRAPDPAELEAAYAEAGSISGLAAHFDVPVHTAQGWITRARRKKALSSVES